MTPAFHRLPGVLWALVGGLCAYDLLIPLCARLPLGGTLAWGMAMAVPLSIAAAALAFARGSPALGLTQLFVMGNALIIWQTLRRSEWGASAGLMAVLALALSIAAAVGLITYLLGRATAARWPQAARQRALVMASLGGLIAWLSHGGATFFEPLAATSLSAADGEPWVEGVQADLRAAAAGAPHGGSRAAATALAHGAELATLRELCFAFAPKGSSVNATPPSVTAGESFGRRLCAAVAAPQAERGAQLLGCPAAMEHELDTQRCRLAGELLAEAGLMEEAARALRRAGAPGRAAAWALWQERQLETPPWLLEEPVPTAPRAWPRGATIGPKQLGFTVGDRPGTLTWHPTGPGPLGALCARSPYRGALVTHVPMPTAAPKPTQASIWIRGEPDLAITLAAASGWRTFHCAGPNDVAAPGTQLPFAACSGAWTRLQLGPLPGAEPIVAARIHGEFLLAEWSWQGAPEELL